MARLKSANNAESTLIGGIAPSDTTFQVGDASVFPSPPFRITVNAEIMEVTGKNNGTNTFFGVSRGMEGTTASNHLAGASVQNRFTAGTHEELVSTDELQAAVTPIQNDISTIEGEIDLLQTSVSNINNIELPSIETSVNQLGTDLDNERAINQARIFRSKTSNQSLPGANIWTPISFDKVLDQHIATSNGTTHSIPEDGIYLISAAINWTTTLAGGANSYLLGSFNVNGRYYRFGGVHSSANGNISCSGSIILNLTAGTTIQIEAFAGSALAVIVGINTEERTYVTIQKL